MSPRRSRKPDPREALCLGLAVLMLRRARGISPQAIEGATGCTKSMLSAIETGKRQPMLDTLRRITQAMGYTMADLWQAHELAKELTDPERGAPGDTSGDGTLPPDDRWPPEEARKAAVNLAQEVGRSVAHVVLSFMELQAGGWPRE